VADKDSSPRPGRTIEEHSLEEEGGGEEEEENSDREADGHSDAAEESVPAVPPIPSIEVD
jgi:hypothetical protein